MCCCHVMVNRDSWRIIYFLSAKNIANSVCFEHVHCEVRQTSVCMVTTRFEVKP